MSLNRVKLAAFAESLKTASAIAAVTLAIFCLVNLVSYPWVRSPERSLEQSTDLLRRARADAALSRYGIDFFRRLYPHKSDAEIEKLLYQHAVLEPIYEPFVEFRMPAIAIDTINNHEAGFRLIGHDQGPWPPDKNVYNVFAFGGSTTWGGGNMDGETIPAYLQALLRQRAGTDRINVYNFGVSAHFSTQEVTYLQNRLRDGFIPDMAVFIDGLNDFYSWQGESEASVGLRTAFNSGRIKGLRNSVQELIRSLPIVRLFNMWQLARAGEQTTLIDYNARYEDDDQIKDPASIRRVIERYLTNKAIAQGIAAEFGIEAIFVWQPVPLYKYDLRLHPFPILAQHRRHRYGYPMMAEYVRRHEVKNLVWCADLGEGASAMVYSDQVHYLAPFNRKIAECIVDGIVSSGKLARGWKRKFGDNTVLANLESPAQSARLGHASVVRLFVQNVRLENLKTSRPAVELAKPPPEGVQLVDDSETHYATVYEKIPIASDAEGNEYTVSARIKPGNSELMLLLLSFQGAVQKDYSLAINPRQSMRVISSNGRSSVTLDDDGWYRLELSGRGNGRGNNELFIAIYPSHGTPQAKGDVLFGGGELRLQAD